MSDRDLVYLDSLVDAADAVLEFVGPLTKEQFFKQRMVRDAVLRNLEVLGEAAGRISPDLQRAHPEVEWKRAAGMRNHLAHGYLNLNLNLIWDTVRRDVPRIGEQARGIRSELERPQ